MFSKMSLLSNKYNNEETTKIKVELQIQTHTFTKKKYDKSNKIYKRRVHQKAHTLLFSQKSNNNKKEFV